MNPRQEKKNWEPVEVSAEFRTQRGKAIAVYVGEKDERGREVWILLPMRLVEMNGNGVYVMPEWLACEKGLI